MRLVVAAATLKLLLLLLLPLPLLLLQLLPCDSSASLRCLSVACRVWRGCRVLHASKNAAEVHYRFHRLRLVVLSAAAATARLILYIDAHVGSSLETPHMVSAAV